MNELVKNKATIYIVNYKTLDFTRLCLRSIRKFTEYPYEIIVIYNNSQDEFLYYLKSLNHLRLIERNTDNDPKGGYKTAELPSAVMGESVIHLAHATQAINPQEFTLRSKTVRKCNRLVKKIMSLQTIKSILEDDSLDQ